MLRMNIAMIDPALVAEQHFFLEELTNPVVIWSIRGICVVGGIVALVVYFRMKNKKGE